MLYLAIVGQGETLIALFGTFGVFGIPLSLIWTYHRRKMLELQLRLKNEGEVGTRAALEALREELRQLKETTLQYDMSFDTALQRMEGRVEGLERRVNQVETNPVNEVSAR